MVKFLDWNTEMEFRRFVQYELADKYRFPIEVREDKIVTGLTGNDEIQEALKIGFFPEYAQTAWVEDKIAKDIHKYCHEHNLKLNKEPFINRTAWNSKIKYELVYTNGGE